MLEPIKKMSVFVEYNDPEILKFGLLAECLPFYDLKIDERGKYFLAIKDSNNQC